MPGNKEMNRPKIRPAGDSAVMVTFGERIEKEINDRVRAFDEALVGSAIDGIVETVPSYSACLVYYDPLIKNFEEIKACLEELISGMDKASVKAGALIEIPVVYGGEYGPDLRDVAEYAGLSEDEVIEIHTSNEYPVYMIGFTPGFPYLGGMDERIACPRLEKPRVSIPAGSVGIAGSQTGVYPSESPGGWRIIGRTPLKLYDRLRERPVLLEPGMRIRFVRISEEDATWE